MKIRNQDLKFNRYNLKNISNKYPDKWLNKLPQLLFKINNIKGSTDNPVKEKVKPDYIQYPGVVHKLNEYCIHHLEDKCNDITTAELKLSEMAEHLYLSEHLEDDLLAVSAVLNYTID